MLARRSNQDILNFIRALPGGNVPQYAKLLNTTCIRLNTLLNTKEGSRLVRKNLVRAPEKGKVSKWAEIAKVERGSLRARDVDRMYKDGTLPPFITKLLETIQPKFRDDSLNYLRETLEHTSNHSSFEMQMRGFVDQERDRTEQITAYQDRTLQLEREMTRVDSLLQRATHTFERIGHVARDDDAVELHDKKVLTETFEQGNEPATV